MFKACCIIMWPYLVNTTIMWPPHHHHHQRSLPPREHCVMTPNSGYEGDYPPTWSRTYNFTILKLPWWKSFSWYLKSKATVNGDVGGGWYFEKNPTSREGLYRAFKADSVQLKKIKSKGQQYSLKHQPPSQGISSLHLLELSEWGGGEEVRPWERDCWLFLLIFART